MMLWYQKWFSFVTDKKGYQLSGFVFAHISGSGMQAVGSFEKSIAGLIVIYFAVEGRFELAFKDVAESWDGVPVRFGNFAGRESDNNDLYFLFFSAGGFDQLLKNKTGR